MSIIATRPVSDPAPGTTPDTTTGTLSIRVSRHRSDMSVITVKGLVDAISARALDGVLRQDLAPRLIVDLSGVPALAPEAADAIVRAHARACAVDHRLSVVVSQRDVAKVLAAAPDLARFPTLSDAIRETPPVPRP